MRRILGILIMMIISVTTAVSQQMSVAHELAHGTNSLHHTFSPESETFFRCEQDRQPHGLQRWHGALVKVASGNLNTLEQETP